MPEKDVAVILAKLDALREVVELRATQNEADHKQVNDHLAMLNGQTRKNTEFRVRQTTINALLGAICVGLLFPIVRELILKI